MPEKLSNGDENEIRLREPARWGLTRGIEDDGLSVEAERERRVPNGCHGDGAFARRERVGHGRGGGHGFGGGIG